jgi:hypothetical protein
MNVHSGSHCSQDVLELYALGMVSVHGCSDIEEHLLICPLCRAQLEAADAYISVVRYAYCLISWRSNSFPRARPMLVAESL